jgi:transcriptional regulator with AAA-type ATPase domain
MEVKKLDKQSAAVFTKLLKEKSYAHFEARSVLLGKKGTGKTTVTRTTHGGEKTRQKICNSFFISMGSPCYCRFTSSLFTQ